MSEKIMPEAQQWLNFRGRMTHMIGEVVGPNTLGEFLTCVEVTYDPVQNKTRSGFCYGIYKMVEEPSDD